MHFQKKCPSCGLTLRFPIDKGKIKVSCTCGYTFIADPDDPSLFKEGNFDLGIRQKRFQSNYLDNKQLKEKAINLFYQFKYDLLNFRLLPASKKGSVLFKVALILLVLMSIIVLINVR